MRTTTSFAVTLIVSFAGVTHAQDAQYRISLYSDPAHTSTEARDQAPGTLIVYVVHENTNGGAATFFKIAPSQGFTGTWIGETSPFSSLGTSPNGIGLAFGGCIYTTQVLEVQYAIVGTSANCSFLDVVADPNSDLFGGVPVIEDCDFEYHAAVGGRLTVNPDNTCSPLPVESKTWGGIKALYR